jgi:hypothetical protein
MMQVCPTFHTYPKLHSKPLVVRYEKEGKIPNAFGKVSFTLSDQENYLRNLLFFAKFIKPLDRWLIKE